MWRSSAASSSSTAARRTGHRLLSGRRGRRHQFPGPVRETSSVRGGGHPCLLDCESVAGKDSVVGSRRSVHRSGSGHGPVSRSGQFGGWQRRPGCHRRAGSRANRRSRTCFLEKAWSIARSLAIQLSTGTPVSPLEAHNSERSPREPCNSQLNCCVTASHGHIAPRRRAPPNLKRLHRIVSHHPATRFRTIPPPGFSLTIVRTTRDARLLRRAPPRRRPPSGRVVRRGPRAPEVGQALA